MTKYAKVLVGTTILIGIVLAGISLGWLGSVESSNPASRPNPSQLPAEPGSTNALRFAKSRPTAFETPFVSSNAPIVPVQTNQIADWEQRLDNVLASQGKESDKAMQLLDMFPNLPEDGQVEIAQHLANLMADQDYAPLANLLTNSVLPESVLDVLMADALNRPNSVKLPLMLALARDPAHPKATEARDLLELFLEVNFGDDWDKWQARMDEWLKDNPD